MTETKLELDEKSKEFLTSPYRKDFMTEFLIGSDKLSFYGQPFVMSFHSELIHTSLPKFAASKPPYELLTFGKVLEKPMTLLWLYMNGFGDQLWSGILNMQELLHLYRLCNYFNLEETLTTQKDEISFSGNVKTHIIMDFIQDDISTLGDIKDDVNKKTLESIFHDFFENKSPESAYKLNELSLTRLIDLRQKLIYLDVAMTYLSQLDTTILVKFVKEPNPEFKYENVKNTLVDIINQFFAKVPSSEDYIPLLNNEYHNFAKNTIITWGLNKLSVILDGYPDIRNAIGYTFVLINDMVESYAEKKVLLGAPTMGKLNPDWKQIADDKFEKCKEGVGCTQLEVDSWGPDIMFTHADILYAELMNEDGYFIKPILT